MENEVEIVFLWFESVKPDILQFYPTERIDHRAIWASTVFRNIIRGIQEENELAIKLGCKLIIDDPFRIPFGKINKSKIGRALKTKASLIKTKDRKLIIKKVIKFLRNGIAPQEVKVYCKLIKKFGVEEFIKEISNIKTENKYVIQLKKYLLSKE